MPDATSTIAELRQTVRGFVAERAWEEFHSPKNLAMSLAIEAAELMEHFQWVDVQASHVLVLEPMERAAIAEEVADVASYLLAFCNVMDLDLSDALRAKMVKNAQKYPASMFRGRFGPKDRRAGSQTSGGEGTQSAAGEGPAGLEANGEPC